MRSEYGSGGNPIYIPPPGESGGVSTSPPPAPAIPLAATLGDPLPVVFGTARTPGRVIYLADLYQDVDIITGVTGSTYQKVKGSAAAAVIAICEAPIASGTPVGISLGIKRDSEWWRNPAGSYMADLCQFGVADWSVVYDAASSAWSHATGLAAGMYWRGVAQFRAFRLGMPNGKVPNLQFEAMGRCILGTDKDAHPAEVVLDLLTTTRPGFLGLAATQVQVDVGLDGLAASSYRAYCNAMGWRVSRAVVDRTSVLELLDSLLQATNASATWSEGKLKIVPLGDRPVGAYAPPATAAVIDADEIVRDSGDAPIAVETVPDSDVYNAWPITIRSRASNYEAATYEWVYASDAAARAAALGGDGVRRNDAITRDWVVTPEHAMKLSQILALRSVHVRNRFRFRLGPRWSLLEPGDLIALTDDKLGLSGQLCRIKSFDARGRGVREVLAEEVPLGVATPVDLTPQAHDGLNAVSIRTEYVNSAAKQDLSNVPAGSVDAPKIAPGAIGQTALGEDVIRTSDYAETTGTIYPENVSGIYATAGAKLFNNSAGVGARIGPGGLRLGRWKMDEITARAINALSSNVTDPASAAYRSWYRGSNDPSINGGGPVLNVGSIAITGAGMQQIGTTGWGWIQFLYSMRPFTGCNWDGLRGLRVSAYIQSATGTGAGITLTPIYDGLVTVPDRRYLNPNNDADPANWTDPLVFNQVESGAYGAAVAVALQLYGVAGKSAGNCYYAAAGWVMNGALTNNGATWPAGWGGTPPTPPPPSGSEPLPYCVDPDTLITTPGGLFVRAGDLAVGNVLWSQDEHARGAQGWRHGTVSAVEHREADRLGLRLDVGAFLIASADHRVKTARGAWVRLREMRLGTDLALGGRVTELVPLGRGPVVQITVPGPATYVSNGILSHNAKAG